jgi:hypothetical protein
MTRPGCGPLNRMSGTRVAQKLVGGLEMIVHPVHVFRTSHAGVPLAGRRHHLVLLPHPIAECRQFLARASFRPALRRRRLDVTAPVDGSWPTIPTVYRELAENRLHIILEILQVWRYPVGLTQLHRQDRHKKPRVYACLSGRLDNCLATGLPGTSRRSKFAWYGAYPLPALLGLKLGGRYCRSPSAPAFGHTLGLPPSGSFAN